MRSISVGRRDSLIWLCFLHEGSVCTDPNQKPPVVWNYMDFISALPSGSYYLSRWWTRHTHTQLQPVEEEEYTLHSSSVYSLRRPGWFCSESNFKYDHFATKNTNWGAVIAAPADLINTQLCHWFLVAGSHSEEQCPKGQACRLKSGITGSTVMYDTLLFLAAIRRLWQFNTSEKWTQP